MFSDQQVAAIRYLIFHSRDCNTLAKQIVYYLINHSEKFTKSVCLSLVEDREGYTADEIKVAAFGFDNLQSCNGTTHTNELFYAIGSDFRFSVHYGDFDPAREDDYFDNTGQFPGFSLSQVRDPKLIVEGMPMRYTFWLSSQRYSRDADYLGVSKEDLNKIDIRCPGLYPDFEPLR